MLRPAHEIFQKPFPVEFALEQTPSPDNFAKWKPGFPATVPTFPIFATYEQGKEEPGLVTSDAGFEDLPDAERILGGINMKGPDYAAVACHGSFVMWGFHTLPAGFTDAGRRLYLNSLAYAVAHKGALVESLRLRPARIDLEHMLTIFMPMYPAAQRMGTLERHYTGEVIPEAITSDAVAGEKWYQERAPFLHPSADGSDWNTAYQLTIDQECKQIGLANDSLAFLDALAARIAKDKADALATTLLARYVPGVPAGEFGAWLAKNREKLYFTESGGWVWRVKGTRAQSPALRVASEGDEQVNVKAEATETVLTITLRIAKGWHTYSPKSTEGKAIEFEILAGSAFEAAGEPDFGDEGDGILRGYVEIKVPIQRVGKGEALSLDFSYTVCDEKACKPTRTIRLTR
ncbi:MAG: hypothetical protein IPJ19_20555 [Planctomycetes bacterium]|nr:hypothetical protein [Planctomycetota bacterium]